MYIEINFSKYACDNFAIISNLLAAKAFLSAPFAVQTDGHDYSLKNKYSNKKQK